MTIERPLALGRLEQVDLRRAWERESTHFTPWLAATENLKMLGEAIGLELELEAQEQEVGPFRADILCKSTQDDSFVLIENQLERTDHLHLGQLLTYAAGLDAVTIVWVAAKFAEEHRAALDWLNEVSHEKISFFGLEVELWRIGNSPVAPKFNVVVKPNGWSKVVRDEAARGASTAHQKFRREYWTGFLNHLSENGSPLSSDRTDPTQHWMQWPTGHAGFRLGAFVGFRDGYIDMALMARTPALFHALSARQADLEGSIGESLTWDYSDTRAQQYAKIRTEQFDPMNRDQWPQQWNWLRSKLELLDRASRPIVATIPR